MSNLLKKYIYHMQQEYAQSIVEYAILLLFVIAVWGFTLAHTMVGGKLYMSILQAFSSIGQLLSQ